MLKIPCKELQTMTEQRKSCIEIWNYGLYEPLKKTLYYAKEQIPYYASKIKTINGQTISELLNCVPLLDKDTAIDNLQELRKEKINHPGRISTGTLRKNKRFMDVQYIEDEDDAIQCFYKNNRSWSHAYNFEKFKASLKLIEKKQLKTPTVILRVLNAHYEIPHLIPHPNTVSILWTSHANTIEIIRETLINLQVISFFEIEATTLIKLTIMLEHSNFDFSQIKIDTIMVYGFLSVKWRNFILDKWNSYISEVFSLSEMRARAYLCDNNEMPHFHFEPLPIVTEVLNPQTKQPITSGAGLLALTPLYPFTQQQLLLRYLTQDVVTIIPCHQNPTLGFSWCGRDRDVLFLDKTDLPHSAFGLREVMECLDKYYEVARSVDDFETLGIIEPGSVGWPLFKIEQVQKDKVFILRLHIILVYPPNLFPDKTYELCNNIKIELISANDYLYKNYNNEQFKFEVIPHPPSQRYNLNGWHQGNFQQLVRNQA